MHRLNTTLRNALAAAGGAFAPLYLAFGWVHRATHILGQDGLSGDAIRGQLGGLLGAMRRHRASVDELGPAVDHFLAVSRSYWGGLFACYDTPGLPRTKTYGLVGAGASFSTMARGGAAADVALKASVLLRTSVILF